MYDEYGDYDHEYDDQLLENCIWPTILQSCVFASWLLIYNTIYTLILHFFCTSEKTFHIVSTLMGLSYIYLCAFAFNPEAYHVLPLVYISFTLLHLFKQLDVNVGNYIAALLIAVLIIYEFLYFNHEAWLQVKSVVMITMMKIMSLAFELKDRCKHIPSIWAFSGYIWCPSNSVLGPWIPFKEYLNRCKQTPKINVQWLLNILKYSLLSIVFVVFSNCMTSFLFPEPVNRFSASFRDALSFRTSHYFISYLASAAMITGGFKSYTITNPLEIELPRSLVSVVTNWNIPMHTFLKKYVFTSFRKYGPFIAVVMTYVISSMLHGLNVEVSIVLLSLALFSYVQFKFQDTVARLANCCVRVRTCRSNCMHKNRFHLNHVLNLLFMLSTMIYLAYTGCLMADLNHTLRPGAVFHMIIMKWQNLNFYGHYLALISVFITCMLT